MGFSWNSFPYLPFLAPERMNLGVSKASNLQSELISDISLEDRMSEQFIGKVGR